MTGEDEVTRSIVSKIEREKALLTAANAMRQSTSNPSVLQSIDMKIKDGRKNIDYLESRLREHQMKQMNAGMANVDINKGYGQQGDYRQPGNYGDGGYAQPGAGAMPPSAPFAKGPPGSGAPKQRPNYSRLGASPVTDAAQAHPSRSYQVRHAASRAPNPAHAVATRVQAQRRKAI
jgi:classical protein kinase C